MTVASRLLFQSRGEFTPVHDCVADHAENYSPDDNRFDLRPFLQPLDFERQFAAIDKAVCAAAAAADDGQPSAKKARKR